MSEQLGIPSVPVIDRIIELQPARVVEIEGFTHIDKDKTVTLFKPPVPDSLSIHTLTGFVGLLETGFEGFDSTAVIVHVDAYDEVHLISKASDKFGRRTVVVKAKALPPERRFNFNQYYSQEEFNISLASMFVQDADSEALIKLAGNLSAQAEVRQQDDGFSQQVTAKAGVHLVKEVVVKPRVTLRPFRTFLEVEQPAGEFIFRVKHDERQGNQCALFEADGGRWKLTAMNTVREWLQNKLRGGDVATINSIPVVA